MKNEFVKLLKNEIKKSVWTGFVHTYPHKKAYRPLETLNMSEVWANVNQLNLYVHIPFCDRKCSYCNLFSTVLNQAEKEKVYDEYVNKLLEEIDYYKNFINKNVQITSLYFGGGTPNVLSINQYNKIITKLKDVFKNWSDGIEICTECSPDRLNNDYLLGLKKIGIDRISIGVQSFNRDELIKVNRPIEPSIIDTIREYAKNANINVNLDLIYGLPSQTKQSIIKNIKQAIKLSPESLSLYPLAIRKFTGLDNKQLNVFSTKQKYDIYNKIRGLVERAGYSCETVVRYVKNNNSTYQQQKYEYSGVPTLGIGAGARSYAPNLSYSITYKVQDKFIKSIIEEYLKQHSDERHFEGFNFNLDEKMRKFAMLSLLDPGINRATFNKFFNVGLEEYFTKEIFALLKLKLVKLDLNKNMYCLTKKGRKYSDLSADIFTSEKTRKLYATYEVE